MRVLDELSESERLLSENTKTGVSLNLPVKNCRPSKHCAKTCYACAGRCLLKMSVVKTLRVDRCLSTGQIDRLSNESNMYANVRLCGTGDFLEEQVPHVLRLSQRCPDTLFWGFTRKVKIANQLNGKRKNLRMLLSVDVSTPTKEYRNYTGKLAFGPVFPGEHVPKDNRISVVFPLHHRGRLVLNIEEHRLDCPAVRGKIGHSLACQACRRCMKGY